jgi:hypothetical protein
MGMIMPIVELSKEEWDAVIDCMSYAPGRNCLPLYNKISPQLQAQGIGVNKQQVQEVPAAQGEINVKHNG